MIELYPHQKKMIYDAVNILNRYGICYIGAETQTGKTLASIFLLKDNFKKILVLTKKKALSGWKKDLALGDAQDRFIIINYESLHKIKDCIACQSGKSQYKTKGCFVYGEQG